MTPRQVLFAAAQLPGRRLAGLLAVLLLPLPLAAQQPSDTPEPPPFYAIQNARIVPVSGDVIDNGTVVIADGLIEAVGRDVPIPPDAWVIDGAGLTVYPGLFDALSTVGLEQAASSRGGDSDLPVSRGPEDRPGTMPYREAADMLDAGASAIEKWRAGGFTTAMTAPADGLVTGRGAVLALAGDASEMVVATPVALRLNMDGSGYRGYPGALFGVIAYHKQLFLDAGHYGRSVAAYRGNPSGRERPRYDRTLEPVHQVVESRLPVLIPGNREREIRRAVELGREIGARTVVYGAQEAWEMGDELKRAGVPVLVNVDWPERSKDPDPMADEAISSLRFRANAPSTPAALQRAGVPFALYSGGSASAADVLKGVRKAVDAGLAPQAAIRAMTLTPAEIYGVADRTGSIQRGKIANLVVTEGDLLAEKPKIRYVFIDGRKFDEPRAEGPAEKPVVDVTGTWTLTAQSPEGAQEVTLELRMEEDGTLAGTVSSATGNSEISSGQVSGRRISFSSATTVGGQSMDANYTGVIDGDNRMEGTITVGEFTTPFSGSRPAAAR